MKKILTIAIFTSISFSIFCQNLTVSIYIEDNVGRKDTVRIGYDELSTIDIDADFGEENIFGASFDSLDIRVIKRDSMNFNCLRENFFQTSQSPNVFFPNNVDTKIDIRPFSWNIFSHDNKFEVFISAMDYPVTVKAVREGFLLDNGLIGGVHVLDADCNSIDFFEIGDQHTETNPQMFVIEDDSFNTLVFEYEILVSTSDISRLSSSWNIFPNPAYDKLEIETEFSFEGQFELINSNGQIVKFFKAIAGTKKTSFDIEDLNKGVYFVRYINEDLNDTSVKKFIKL